MRGRHCGYFCGAFRLGGRLKRRMIQGTRGYSSFDNEASRRSRSHTIEDARGHKSVAHRPN
jgi:hypothetical protein